MINTSIQGTNLHQQRVMFRTVFESTVLFDYGLYYSINAAESVSFHNYCILISLSIWSLKLVRTLLNVYFTAFKSSFLSLSMHM